jgi:hypothetical protein
MVSEGLLSSSRYCVRGRLLCLIVELSIVKKRYGTSNFPFAAQTSALSLQNRRDIFREDPKMALGFGCDPLT